MVGVTARRMMMSHSDFLTKELSSDEEAAVDRIVSSIEAFGHLPDDELVSATLIATIGLLTSLDPKKAHLHLIQAAESAAMIAGNPIAIFYKNVDHVDSVSH